MDIPSDRFHTSDIFFIVDGAQTAGHIPINLSDIPVGAYVFTGHKALFGIPGIGGFYFHLLLYYYDQGERGIFTMKGHEDIIRKKMKVRLDPLQRNSK